MYFSSLVQCLWILLLLIRLQGSRGDNITCPNNYPFDSCPRHTDEIYETKCCIDTNGEYSCCFQPVFPLLVIIAIGVVGFLVSLCLVLLSFGLCPWFCLARPKQSDYDIVKQRERFELYTDSELDLDRPSTSGANLDLYQPSTSSANLDLDQPSTSGANLDRYRPSTSGATLDLDEPSTSSETDL